MDHARSVGKLSVVFLSVFIGLAAAPAARANGNVYVSRFWHNHQPIYWPEWNGNGDQSSRVQYAWDSISQKPWQNYGGLSSTNHPENDLGNIFGLDDRRNAYQSGPRNSLTTFDSRGGFALSYSGSLIDNIRQLGEGGHLGYGGGWWDGNREARHWQTGHGASGGRRLDLVGFTYHHSLAPLLPKPVLRKEIQIFKQAWWKAWGGHPDLSDHSKGFFPTEMAFSRHIVDVLADEGYEWVIVASHHLSRTCPTYNTKADLQGSYNIFSSPPNKSDQLGPSPTTGWWYGEPNPGNAAWNVSPYAYQLHKVQYVNPNADPAHLQPGDVKSIVAVPSDDVLSYRYGYANEGIGKIGQYISPFANDPARPVIVMPATDGDNAWGGGSSSWMEATPQLFNGAASAGYQPTSVQDFVNAHKDAAPVSHVEDGAWIFPEVDYGSPYFLKWIEPPVANAAIGANNRYPGTQIDLETPGFALKFYSYAPLMAGANWCVTAEQILSDENSGADMVNEWKIQAPYDWDGTWTAPNEVELAWHLYLAGLDSGFNYYGGLGNDDEVKPGLATRRAVEKLRPWMTEARRANDRTPPTVLKPQRFPHNPGWFTFGWFNRIPGGDERFLKRMPSEFYVWTHAYDLSGVSSVNLKVRVDADGVNTLANFQNETYAGGADVGSWTTIPMNKRTLPKTREALNAAANNSQIDYFLPTPEDAVADYYFAKISNATLPGFRNHLLDYYIEAADARGNVHKSEIQHVWVEDDGAVSTPPATPSGLAATPISDTRIDLSWNAVANATDYTIRRTDADPATVSGTTLSVTGLQASTMYSFTVTANNAAGSSSPSDPVAATTFAQPPPPATPGGLTATAVSHEQIDLAWQAAPGATGYLLFRDGIQMASVTGPSYSDVGLVGSTTHQYSVSAYNGSGQSPPSNPVSATTPAAPVEFAMDGEPDFAGYRVSNPGMTLYAAVRGSILYVSTWTPSGGNNDHFILVSDTLLSSASTPAHWDKAGFTAQPAGKPYLAAESENEYCAWVNAPANSSRFRATTNGQQMEGSLNLLDAFGYMPETVYLTALAYQTANAGLLGAQAPAASGAPDNLVPAAEFLALPVKAIQDSLANGVYDFLDPARAFRLETRGLNAEGLKLAWPAVPGRTYRLWHSPDLSAGSWTATSTLTAPSGVSEIEILDADIHSETRAFYKIEALAP